MRAALLVLALALTSCSATVGSSSWALANGFCVEGAAMALSVSIGHCGEVEDGEEEEP